MELHAALLLLVSLAAAAALPGLATPLPDQTDFLLVGAGTAGCLLASRLCAARPDSSFMLLERGEQRSPEREFLVRTSWSTYAAWADHALTEASMTAPSRALTFNESSVILTGATLGGTSAINGMQWTRPDDAFFETWGLNNLTAAAAATRLDRLAAQLGVAVPPEHLEQAFTKHWISSARANAGLPEVDDPVAGKLREGVFRTRVTADAVGQRIDSCAAFLTPALQGPCKHNLELIQGANVRKLTFTGSADHRRATGAIFLKDGKEIVVRALKQVLVSAGPINTPKLLQLSGIGPPEVLKAAGVQPQVDLDVGLHTFTRPGTLVSSAYNPALLPRESDPNVVSDPAEKAKAFMRKPSIFGVTLAGALGHIPGLGYLQGTNHVGVPGMPVQLTVCLLSDVASKGSVTIQSPEVLVPPTVRANFYDHPDDLTKMSECVERVRPINAGFPPQFGMTETTGSLSSTELTLRSTISAHHVVGGAALGVVVDKDFTVKGFENLRVVDASVMPALPAVGPMSAVYLLADVAADEILSSC